MRITPECVVCFAKQALYTSRLVNLPVQQIQQILAEVTSYLSKVDYSLYPPEVASEVYKIIKNITGISDPYAQIKKDYNHFALALYDKLKDQIRNSPDPIAAAINICSFGNLIDFGTGSAPNIDGNLEKMCAQNFAIYEIKPLKKRLAESKSILYLGDNAGEIVFDKLLIETLIENYPNLEDIVFAVRGKPIINDATLEDAQQISLFDLVEVIDNGDDCPGTVLSRCSEKFLKHFRSANLIFSKGQGNYETLSEIKDPRLVYLLQVKCQIVANGFEGIKVGDGLLLVSERRNP